VLECVVNISEGRDAGALALLAQACGACLLDLHADGDHHRAVLTMAGDDEVVEGAVRDLARTAVSLLDLSGHSGVHPRFGVLDVVPWVALEGWPVRDATAGTSGPNGRKRRATASLYGPRSSWICRCSSTGPSAPCLSSAGRRGGVLSPMPAPMLLTRRRVQSRWGAGP